ncbi:uncharacterized [Tachysurus ichikawai]
MEMYQLCSRHQGRPVKRHRERSLGHGSDIDSDIKEEGRKEEMQPVKGSNAVESLTRACNIHTWLKPLVRMSAFVANGHG